MTRARRWVAAGARSARSLLRGSIRSPTR